MSPNGYTNIPNPRMSDLIAKADCKMALLLALESRRGYDDKALTFGELIDITAIKGMPRARRTFETALSNLIKSGDVFCQDGRYITAEFAAEIRQKGGQKGGQKRGQKAAHNVAKMHPLETVSDAILEPLIKGSKELIEINIKQPPPTPPEAGGDPERIEPLIQVKLEPTPKSKPPAELELPDWLPLETWQDWLAYRRQRRLTCTPMTLKAQITDLQGFLEAGMDLERIIRKSISSGWQGLFAEKSSGYRSGASPGPVKPKINDEDVWAQADREQDAFIASLGVISHGNASGNLKN